MKIFALFIFAILFIYSYVYSSELSLSEEEKQKLNQAILEKSNNLPELQQKTSDYQTVEQQIPKIEKSIGQNQIMSLRPKWDGVYIVDLNDNYLELKSIKDATVKSMKGRLTGREYLDINIRPEDINYVFFNNIKGFFFKGEKVISEIKILKIRKNTSFFSGVSAFLSGMIGGQNFIAENLNYDMYYSEFRCASEANTIYCEFIDSENVKKKIGLGQKENNCLLALTGTSPEKGGKAYVICFKENEQK